MIPDLRREIESMPLVLAEPETPFWGFGEVFMMAAVFLIALGLVGSGALGLLHEDAKLGYWQVAAEFIAYIILFAALKLVFFWAGKPLFRSLGWVPHPFSPASLLGTGFVLSALSAVLLVVLRTPEIQTPFDRMLNGDPLSRIVIVIFGITFGPVIEELLFRGLMQPVLVSAAGVFPGILLTSLFFGGLHLTQNAGLWQSGIVITLAGFAFGVVRHVT
ncbi:MAG: type II CAAX endopeptidase family protein, partial [Acidobacteriota bacterium]